MDIEEIIFGIYAIICLIAFSIMLVIGIYTITTGNTNSNTNDYQKCICERLGEE